MEPTTEPGRDLDARVAAAMGWTDFWRGSDEYRSYLMAYPPAEMAMGIEAVRATVPHYSTDIAAAWQVVTWLTTPPQHYAVQVEQLSRYARVRIRRGNQTRWPINKELFNENSTAYAICLAFLDVIAKGPL